ncbi:MAG: ATP-binding protein [Solirubrobacteraceae bacterium]
MRSIPVRWRLTLAFTLVMTAVLGVTGAFVHERLAANLDSSIAASLRARIADVTALAQQSDTGLQEARTLRPGRSEIGFAQLIDVSDRVLDRTPGLSTQPLLDGAALAAARRGGVVTREVVLATDEPVRVRAAQIRAQDQRLVVVVGQSLEARNQAVRDLSGVLLIGGPAALLLAALAGYALTAASLRPVEAMRRHAANLTATNLDGRLPPAGGNDELGRLGRTLNDMLERIQAAVTRERTFVSDASHELRSPLAMLRIELELVARDHPTGPALDQAVASAIEEAERLTQLTDDLLMLARSDDSQIVLEVARVSAAQTLVAAAERARRRHPRMDETITVDPGQVSTIAADPSRLAQALDNMLDNAVSHASTHVVLAARDGGDHAELHVIDDGPGFPPAFLPHAWNRFTRADAAHTENGTGLGLAIVMATAELHGGRAYAENLEGGGADVWITLPEPPARRVD